MAAKDLKIRLDSIGHDGYDVDEVVEQAWLVEALGSDSPFVPEGAGEVRAHLYKVDEVVHVRGRARLHLRTQCSRCLDEVSLALDAPMEVAMFPRGHEPAANPDGEVAEEDMGVDVYENDEIDLAHLLHDEVFLELPISPICSERCAGLCRQCGENLNTNSCQCVPEVDLRWQALKNIKLKKELH